MGFRPIAAFKNRQTRARAIIWTGVLALVVILVMGIAVAATTSYWFCAEICHKVQDDSIDAYNRSSHSKVSCVSCHMPPGADPVTFLLHKVEALAELPPTIFNTYTLPLNPDSHIALDAKQFPDLSCTQCHNLENRVVTASEGIIIDHEVHMDSGVRCTFCHNRVAHDESDPWTPKLSSPGETEKAAKHQDYMEMTACYRCHGLEEGSPATGECAACHTPGFELMPPDHFEPHFMSVHGKLAIAEHEKNRAAEEKHGVSAPTPAEKSSQVAALKSTNKKGDKNKWPVAPADTINRCYTCHVQESFCDSCHGVAMPHPAEFLEPVAPGDAAGHPALSKDPELAAKCVMCHGVESQTHFCSSCHHGEKSNNWNFDTSKDWTSIQHTEAVGQDGFDSCMARCHDLKFCNDCHANLTKLPVSHLAADFVRPATPSITVFGQTPAPVRAGHALTSLQSTKSCTVCHGEEGIKSAFCMGCHQIDLPHEQQFKNFHSGQNKNVCANCHGSFETCSSCHHVGSSQTATWLSVHGISVNENTSSTCLGKCHKQDQCVECHMGKKVIPVSHKAGDFVKGGAHATAYNKNAENCAFCHTGAKETLPNTSFCKNCHVLDMPHPRTGGPQKYEHKEGLNKGTLTRAMCQNCHNQRFCDACHHVDSVETQAWMTYHPSVVYNKGPELCYECHQELECAKCHVSLSRR